MSLLVPIFVTATVFLMLGHAQQTCQGGVAGPQGPPGRNGLPGPRGKQGEKGDPGLPASQDPKLQNDLNGLRHRITRLERALTLNGKIVLAEGKLFATTELTADFDNTVKKCREAHGRIAAPTNRKENDAIMSLAKQHNTYAYIGITEGHVPGEFQFLDGTPLNFTNWYGGEPKGKGTEKCVEMYTDGTWNDRLCTNFRLTVCEF